MNRPQRIRAVFQELRNSLGSAVSAGEALILATAIVNANARVDRELGDGFGRPHFSALPVDAAMSDGGWRILEREVRGGMPITDELPDNYWAIERRIKRLREHSHEHIS